MTTKYTFFLPVQPVQVCILPVQRTGGLVSGLAYGSVIANVSVPYRHAGVTQVLMTLPFSLFEIRRSAITPSTTLHTFAPTCALRRSSLSVFPSPHTAPPRYTKLSACVSFFPSSSMSSSSLWWPMFSTSVFSRLIFSPFHSCSVSCSSCLPFATRAMSSA